MSLPCSNTLYLGVLDQLEVNKHSNLFAVSDQSHLYLITWNIFVSTSTDNNKIIFRSTRLFIFKQDYQTDGLLEMRRIKMCKCLRVPID